MQESTLHFQSCFAKFRKGIRKYTECGKCLGSRADSSKISSVLSIVYADCSCVLQISLHIPYFEELFSALAVHVWQHECLLWDGPCMARFTIKVLIPRSRAHSRVHVRVFTNPFLCGTQVQAIVTGQSFPQILHSPMARFYRGACSVRSIQTQEPSVRRPRRGGGGGGGGRPSKWLCELLWMQKN